MLKAVGLAIALSAPLAVNAGVQVEMSRRDRVSGKEEPAQTMQVQDGKARFDASGQRRGVALFKDDKLYLLNTEKKTYLTLDRASVEKTASAMNDVMTQLRARMEKMPPEQRAMMENMMKKNGVAGPATQAQTISPPKMDAIATGANETVAGRACKVWDITRDGVPTSQLCVVPSASLPGHQEFIAITEKMSALLAGLSANLSKQMGTAVNGNPLQQDPAVLAKINGMPFIVRQYRDGKLATEETVVKSWSEQTIADTQFAIGADYTADALPKLPTKLELGK
jgi:uncharacterized coiled-coil protein SlyX